MSKKKRLKTRNMEKKNFFIEQYSIITDIFYGKFCDIISALTRSRSRDQMTEDRTEILGGRMNVKIF